MVSNHVWVQCSLCQKWRRVAHYVPDRLVKDRWTCTEDGTAPFNQCEVAEEGLYENEVVVPTPSYTTPPYTNESGTESATAKPDQSDPRDRVYLDNCVFDYDDLEEMGWL